MKFVSNKLGKAYDRIENDIRGHHILEHDDVDSDLIWSIFNLETALYIVFLNIGRTIEVGESAG